MHKLKDLKLLVALSAILGISILAADMVGATPVKAATATISHAYHSAGSIPGGSIVSLDSGRSNYVQPANTTNGSRLVGVAIADNSSLLAINPTAGEIEIATSGTVTTLVSTLSGNITAGNQIAVSPLIGVGMKAGPGSHVIGLAEAAFSSGSVNATAQVMKDSAGKTHRIAIGYIPVTIVIGSISASAGGPELNGLQKLVQSLTGHVISTARIILALLVAVVAIGLLMVLTYGSIYGSIISIGRNPLAKYVIVRNLTSVLLMAGLTTVIAALIIFFLLR